MQIMACPQAPQSCRFPILWNKVVLIRSRRLLEDHLDHIYSRLTSVPLRLLPPSSETSSKAPEEEREPQGNESICKKSLESFPNSPVLS